MVLQGIAQPIISCNEGNILRTIVRVALGNENEKSDLVSFSSAFMSAVLYVNVCCTYFSTDKSPSFG